MSTVLINESYLYDIANKIRTKNKTVNTYTLNDMVSAINLISGNKDFQKIIQRTIDSFENNEITKIGDAVFKNCSTLQNISLPMVTVINSEAFQSCINLRSLFFPLVTEIKTQAFRTCSSLTTISFPSCSIIGDLAFSDCRNLTTISFPMAQIIGNEAFYNCNMSIINLPQITTISFGAFSYCHNLTTAILKQISSFGMYVFYSCNSLLSVYLIGTSVVSLTSYLFSYTPISSSINGTYGSIFVRASLLNYWRTAAGWTDYFDRFVGLTDEQIAELDNT